MRTGRALCEASTGISGTSMEPQRWRQRRQRHDLLLTRSPTDGQRDDNGHEVTANHALVIHCRRPSPMIAMAGIPGAIAAVVHSHHARNTDF